MIDRYGASRKHRPVGRGRDRLLLEEELDAVGRGLQHAVGARAVGPDAVLHVGDDLAHAPDVEHHRDEQDHERDDDLDQTTPSTDHDTCASKSGSTARRAFMGAVHRVAVHRSVSTRRSVIAEPASMSSAAPAPSAENSSCAMPAGHAAVGLDRDHLEPRVEVTFTSAPDSTPNAAASCGLIRNGNGRRTRLEHGRFADHPPVVVEPPTHHEPQTVRVAGGTSTSATEPSHSQSSGATRTGPAACSAARSSALSFGSAGSSRPSSSLATAPSALIGSQEAPDPSSARIESAAGAQHELVGVLAQAAARHRRVRGATTRRRPRRARVRPAPARRSLRRRSRSRSRRRAAARAPPRSASRPWPCPRVRPCGRHVAPGLRGW